MATGCDVVTVTAGPGLSISLGFPSGATLDPGGGGGISVPATDLAHPVVAAWVADGLVVSGTSAEAPEAAAEPVSTEAGDKAALIDKAKALGIAVDRRWGADRLAAEIAAAEAAKLDPAASTEAAISTEAT